MRKLFAIVTNSGASKEAKDPPTPLLPTGTTTTTSFAPSEAENNTSKIFLAAAQSFSDAVQEILADITGLQENISGFRRLFEILNWKLHDEDIGTINTSRGVGSLDILLKYSTHSLFVEKCNDIVLSTALLHVLRLLRMFEIRQAKNGNIHLIPGLGEPAEPSSPSSSSSGIHGVTFDCSKRLCRVLSILVADRRTTEKLRQSVIKLVTFPLSILPQRGIHLQEHSADMVHQMCKGGMTSQQVLLLHEVQAMLHMVRHLSELTTITPGEDATITASAALRGDQMLQGLAAEQAGMWLTGVSCIVDIITASVSVSPVLMTDFESAGGFALFQHILQHSSQERHMATMNTISLLLYDPQKGPEEPLAFPSVGSTFLNLLVGMYGLQRGIDATDGMEQLVTISQDLTDKFQVSFTREFVILDLAYILLTIYSSDPRNCMILEETYHFLPMLIVCLPSLKAADTISAVLTNLNYVCQCVDSAAQLPVVTLCASVTVMVSKAVLNCGVEGLVEEDLLCRREIRTLSLQQLDASCASFETIIRSQSKYAAIVIESGMMKYLLSTPLKQLYSALTQISSSREGGSVQEESAALPVLVRAIDFAITVHRRSHSVAEQIRTSGLKNAVQALVSLPATSADLCDRLLTLLEELSKNDAVLLEETGRMVTELLRDLFGNALRTRSLCTSLHRILLHGDEGLLVWRNINGFGELLGLVVQMEEIYEGVGSLTSASGAAAAAGFVSISHQHHSTGVDGFYAAPSSSSASSSGKQQQRSSSSHHYHGGHHRDDQRRRTRSISLGTASVADMTDCLFHVMRCFSLYSSLKAPVWSSSSARTSREDDAYHSQRRYNYRLLVDALYKTGIFGSGYADRGLEMIFSIISGTVLEGPSKPMIVNPEAAEMVMSLIPRLPPTLCNMAIRMFQEHAGGSVDGKHLLCEAGVTSVLIETYHQTFVDGSNPIGMSLLKLLQGLIVDYLTLRDFATILYYIIRVDLLGNSQRFKLMPPWQAVRGGGLSVRGMGTNANVNDGSDDSAASRNSLKAEIPASRCWDSLQLLVEMAADPKSTQPPRYEIPSIPLGLAASPLPDQAPSHLSVLLSEATKAFPSSNFTYCCWLRMVPPEDPSISDPASSSSSAPRRSGASPVPDWLNPRGRPLTPPSSASNEPASLGVIPILALTCSSIGGCFLEAHYDLSGGFVRLLVRKGKVTTTLRFRAPDSVLKTFDWNLLTISFRRMRNNMFGAKSVVSVYFNGLIGVMDTQDTVDLDIPSSSQYVELTVGKFVMELPSLTADSAAGDSGLQGELTLPKLYRVGPLVLFDEALTQHQQSLVFLRGPSYAGTFQAEAPLNDYLATVSSHLLRKCNIPTKPSDTYISELGLKGLECVVDPLIEQSSFTVAAFELPTVPPPLLAYSPANSSTTRIPQQDSNNFTTAQKVSTVNQQLLRLTRTVFSNSASYDNNSPVATLLNGKGVSAPHSVASCVASLGGPALLFPLIQAASDEKELCQCLSLVKSCVRKEISNAKFMQSSGYKTLGFLLTLKQKELITPAVMNAMFELAIDRGTDDNAPTPNPTVLFTDTPAFYHLLMNHQAWDPKRFSYAMKVLSYFSTIIVDERYAQLNTKRLSALGAVRWLLLLSVFATDSSSARGNPSVATTFSASTAAAPTKPLPKNPSTATAPKNPFAAFLPPSSQKPSPPPPPPVANADDREQSESPSIDEWTFSHCSTVEAADGSDEKDPFLTQVMEILRLLTVADVRTRDLEFIGSIILYSFHTRNLTKSSKRGAYADSSSLSPPASPPSTLRQLKQLADRASASSSQAPSQGVVADESRPLSPAIMLRIYLLRLLTSVYTDITEDWSNQLEHNGMPSATATTGTGAGGRARSATEWSKPAPAASSSSSYFSSMSSSSQSKASAPKEPVAISSFRSVFTPDWFIGVFDKPIDPATRSQALRLLAVFLQRDAVFSRDFSAKKGWSCLEFQFSTQPLTLASVLPLIALLLRIPVHLIPKSWDVTRLKETIFELVHSPSCLGPDVTEPALSEFSLPLLSLLIDCVISGAKLRKERGSALMSVPGCSSPHLFVGEFVVDILTFCVNANLPFRQLLQHRLAVESVSTALVTCWQLNTGTSHGHRHGVHAATAAAAAMSADNPSREECFVDIDSETSSAIFFEDDDIHTTTEEGFDEGLAVDSTRPPGAIPRNTSAAQNVLRSFMRSATSASTMTTNRSSFALDPTKILDTADTVTFHDPEGRGLLLLISKTIRAALTELESAQIVGLFLMSFSQASVGRFLGGFQLLVFDYAKAVLDETMEDTHAASGQDIARTQVLVNMLTHIVPFARSRILDDFVLVKFLSLSVYTTSKILAIALLDTFDLVSEKDKLNSPWVRLLKDVAMTARYLSCICVTKSPIDRPGSLASFYAALNIVRTHIPLLLSLTVSSSDDDMSDFVEKDKILEDKLNFDVIPITTVATVQQAVSKSKQQEEKNNISSSSTSTTSSSFLRMGWGGSSADDASPNTVQKRGSSGSASGAATVTVTGAETIPLLSLSLASAEKRRLAQAFCMHMLDACSGILLWQSEHDEDDVIRGSLARLGQEAPAAVGKKLHDGPGNIFGMSENPLSLESRRPQQGLSDPVVGAECSRILAMLMIYKREVISSLLSVAAVTAATAATTASSSSTSVPGGSSTSGSNTSSVTGTAGGGGGAGGVGNSGGAAGTMPVAKTAFDADFLRDSLLQLVPLNVQDYEKFILFKDIITSDSNTTLYGSGDPAGEGRQNRDDDQRRAERNRLSEFKIWLNDNRSSWLKAVGPMASYLRAIAPSSSEITDTLRQLHATSSRTRDGQRSAAMIVLAAIRHTDNGQKLSDQIALHSRRWLVHGFMHVAFGAFQWKRIWNALQAGPIWGYMSINTARSEALLQKLAEAEGGQVEGITSISANNNALKTLNIGLNNDSSSSCPLSIESYKGWQLDPAEGPERACRRIRQDYSDPLVPIIGILSPMSLKDTTSNSHNNSRSHSRVPSHQFTTGNRDLSLPSGATSTITTSPQDKLQLVPVAHAVGIKPDLDLAPQPAATAATIRPLSPDSSTDAGMEAFLREIQQKGVSLKRTTSRSFDELEATILDEDSEELKDLLQKAGGAESCGHGPHISSAATASLGDDAPIRARHQRLDGDTDCALAVGAASGPGLFEPKNYDDNDGQDRDDDDSLDEYSDENAHEISFDARDDPGESYELENSSSREAAKSPTAGWFSLSSSASQAALLPTTTTASSSQTYPPPSQTAAAGIAQAQLHGSSGTLTNSQQLPSQAQARAGAIQQTTSTAPSSSAAQGTPQRGGGLSPRPPPPPPGLRGDTEVYKRSAMLIELVKGAVGAMEWHHGKKFNVNRVSGLEAQPALLVLTATNLHILTGFKIRPSIGIGSAVKASSGSPTKAAGDRVLVEWVAASPAAAKAAATATAAQGTSTAGYSSSLIGGTDSSSTTNTFPPQANTTGAAQTAAAQRGKLQTADAAYNAAAVGIDRKEQDWLQDIWTEVLTADPGYHRMPLDEVYSIFKRRYQLKNTAMELTDISGYSLMFSCESHEEFDAILLKLFEAELPNSIFYHVIGMKNLQLLRGLSNMYNRLMGLFLSSITSKWQRGELSNFEYLMHLNAAAGRSFQDLTQYPVFPWILADYTSDTLDLTDPKTFRDLSKPMGALGLKRAIQYRERYRSMDDFRRTEIEDTPPPFYYGTHYSCAGYVLHYLTRLQPYANMAIALQGGHFDKPDRLFFSIEQSWLSASSLNLQDVRELVPEFYYLPEFLTNSNKFEFGETQKGDMVDDVMLPKWAKGDPREFIRLHREALESRFVSENLHEWIDLIFGYKQRGPAAEEAMNVFIHLTYDGEVDIDAITDPLMRDATISQINNFGQTPSRLFSKPHPRRLVPDIIKRVNDQLTVDTYALAWHEHVSPPLCVVGASQMTVLNKVSHAQVSYPSISGASKGTAVGDCLLASKDKVIAVPRNCILLPLASGTKKFIRFGGPSGGVSVHSTSSSVSRSGTTVDIDREGSYHEQLHQRVITCVAICRQGGLIATGSEDCSVRLWNANKLHSQRKFEHLHTLTGHSGHILSLDISADFHVIVAGSADFTATLWDTRAGKLLRILGIHNGPVISVSVSPLSGRIATLTTSQLRMYTINGTPISVANITASASFSADISELPFSFYNSAATSSADSPSASLMSSNAVPAGAAVSPLILHSPTTGTSTGNSNSTLQQSQESSATSTEVAAAFSVVMTSARVVLAPPCAEWQDGVIAVTGHDNGLVYLWKLHRSCETDTDGKEVVGRYLVPIQLTKTHKAAITTLRLCPLIFSKSKEIVDRSFRDAGNQDLLVGDEDGFVSRWTALRLEQVPQGDLVTLFGSKYAYREVGGSAAAAAVAAAAVGASGGGMSFTAPGGLLKYFSGGSSGGSGSGVSASASSGHYEMASVLASKVQEIEDCTSTKEDASEEYF